jgi:hypothetical protein
MGMLLEEVAGIPRAVWIPLVATAAARVIGGSGDEKP